MRNDIKYQLEYGQIYKNLEIGFKDETKLKECINYLFIQCVNLYKYLRISNCIYYSLAKKYTHLDNKWYTFAFNAVEEAAAVTMCRLYDNHKQAYSFYNLLKYLCNETNSIKFFNDVTIIKESIAAFNLHGLILFDEIKKIRNKRYMHITEAIFDKNFADEYSTKYVVYELSYRVAHKILNVLWEKLTGKKLEFISKDNFNEQLNKFVDLLGVNGDLQ